MTYEQIKQEEKKLFEHWLKGAEAGDARAEWLVGECYRHGRGVAESKETAVEWLKKAAEQGHAEAQYALGECYFFGEGIEGNVVTAAKWYAKAAEQGHIKAQYKLAECYFWGSGVDANQETAMGWYRKAAEQGHADAQARMGELCLARNPTEAIKWLEKSLRAEYSELAVMEILKNKKPLSRAEAIFLEALDCLVKETRFEKLKQAAELGLADAQCELAECYFSGEGVDESHTEAIKWYTKAAEQGHAKAQYELAECYFWGYGVKTNYVKAVKWYINAAKQGYASAQYSLGECYYYGDGIKINYAKALEYFKNALVSEEFDDCALNIECCKERLAMAHEMTPEDLTLSNAVALLESKDTAAEGFKTISDLAEKGYGEAQFQLGECYKNGYGIRKNTATAIKWYTKAAEQDLADAQYALAECYFEGDGVKQDFFKALELYNKARHEYECEEQITECKKAILLLAEKSDEGAKLKAVLEKKLIDRLAELLNDADSADEALAQLRELAGEKNGAAAMELAKYYSETGDHVSMIEYLTLSADAGHAGALFELGKCFYLGFAVSQSYENALYYWEKAAELDCAEAIFNLGVCYCRGQGVKCSPAKAFELWQRSYSLGFKSARSNLARCYERGFGTQKDISKAIGIYEELSRDGDMGARVTLKRLKGGKR